MKGKEQSKYFYHYSTEAPRYSNILKVRFCFMNVYALNIKYTEQIITFKSNFKIFL